MDTPAKQREFEDLKAKVERLEEELLDTRAKDEHWRPTSFYGAYYATTGSMLGIFGAAAALLVNVIGAPLAGKHPLELIRVYLTFPMGEMALRLTDPARNVPAVEDGMILTFGCCLYFFTGMLLGIPFCLLLARFGNGSLKKRLIVGSFAAIAVWLVGFYGVLAWLQPLLFGGNWIVDPARLPWWVAAGTHLVYGWTMALVYPLGQFVPYQIPTERT